MSDRITLTIDGKEITVEESTTILDAAASLGIEIPIICYHPKLTPNGLCRVCSVDAGSRVQLAACVTDCQQGMEIQTDSDEIARGRRTILEMLASTVDLSEAPEIIELLKSVKGDASRFSLGAKREAPVYDDNPFYIRDYSQCINCWRCVQVCADDAQYAYALSFDGRGFDTQIGTFMGLGMMETSCVFCGQCVGVCPTGALKPKRQDFLERGIEPDSKLTQTKRSKRRSRT